MAAPAMSPVISFRALEQDDERDRPLDENSGLPKDGAMERWIGRRLAFTSCFDV
jgi:hypothetical protein